MRWIILFFLLMPIVHALQCDLNNPYCSEILNSNLNDSDKDYIISSLVHEKVNFPNHEFVYDHNTNIKVDDIKDKVAKENKGYIKNAFVKLIALMPSVIENNSLFVNNGEIYSLFDHEIEIPAGTASGDCQTKYYVTKHDSVLNAYSDDNYLGSGNLVNFSVNQDADLNVKYLIELTTNIDHYKLRTYCCARGKRGCKRYCSVCEYSYTEVKNDNLALNDNALVKYYDLRLNASFNVVDEYYDTTKGILNVSNFTALEFKFSDSYFNKYNYFYTLNWSSLNAVTVKAEKYPVESSSNLIKEDKFLVKNTDDCIITLYDYFKKIDFPCNLSFSKPDILIKTDKLTYYNNETIKVKLFPSDLEFNLSYSNYSIIAKNNIELKAIQSADTIKITYNDLSYEKYIHIKDKEKWNFLFNLLIFVGVNFSIVKLSRRIFRKIWNAD